MISATTNIRTNAASVTQRWSQDTFSSTASEADVTGCIPSGWGSTIFENYIPDVSSRWTKMEQASVFQATSCLLSYRKNQYQLTSTSSLGDESA